MLEDVLYISTNKHNLISPGRWDKAGGRYVGGDGKINLVTKNGKHVATGNKINDNLYKMQITTYHCNNNLLRLRSSLKNLRKVGMSGIDVSDMLVFQLYKICLIRT